MKTIKEISVERSLDRSTLLKAAQRGYIPARKSGSTWLVDDESPTFLTWLYVYRHRRHASPSLPAAATPE